MSAGTVYLLHFDRPYKHARHYIGWAASSRSLKARLAQHGTSEGARLLAVARAGYDEGYARGYDDGYGAGHAAGYAAGYSAGAASCK